MIKHPVFDPIFLASYHIIFIGDSAIPVLVYTSISTWILQIKWPPFNINQFTSFDEVFSHFIIYTDKVFFSMSF